MSTPYDAKDSLGRKLRAIRKLRGYESPADFSRLFNGRYSVSGILKRERGEIKISSTYVEDFCVALKITGREKKRILGLAEIFLYQFDAWRSSEKTVQQVNLEFGNRLRCADHYRSYETAGIPGLFQTQSYTYEMLRSYGKDHSDALEISVIRSSQLNDLFSDAPKFMKKTSRAASPNSIQVVLHENALYSVVGSVGVMRDQLQSLRHYLIPTWNNRVELRILPRNLVIGAPVGWGFSLFDSSSVLVETVIGGQSLSDDTTIEWLTRVFDAIWKNAVNGPAMETIINAAFTWYDGLSWSERKVPDNS